MAASRAMNGRAPADPSWKRHLGPEPQPPEKTPRLVNERVGDEKRRLVDAIHVAVFRQILGELAPGAPAMEISVSFTSSSVFGSRTSASIIMSPGSCSPRALAKTSVAFLVSTRAL